MRPPVLLLLALSLPGCRDIARALEEHDRVGEPPTKQGSAKRGGDRPKAVSEAPPPGKGKPKSSPSTGAGDRSIHLELGVPGGVDPSDDHLLVRSQYALSYSRKRNGPNWVGWNLNAAHFGSVPRHRGKFMPDPLLPQGFYAVRHDDYTDSGFDRGHMVRSEERTRTPEDNLATFFTTNLLPQRHDLNAGPWLRFEEHCQALAQKEGKELFVVAGGIFEGSQSIGRGVAVPRRCFKIVVVLQGGGRLGDVTAQTEILAVDMPNDTGILGRGWEPYRTTVDRLEQATGYDFLTALPDAIEAALEAR